MRTILLIMIGLSSYLSADFTKSGEVVTDSTTGLMWQDNGDTNSKKRTWQEAIDYCEALDLEDYNDWRLPNINELKTIIDRSKSNPSIVDGFDNIGSNYYWSSSSELGDSHFAWMIEYYVGRVETYYKDSDLYVRCVRDGQ